MIDATTVGLYGWAGGVTRSSLVGTYGWADTGATPFLGLVIVRQDFEITQLVREEFCQ